MIVDVVSKIFLACAMAVALTLANFNDKAANFI